MRKILLTIIGLAMASPAWAAQTAVTPITATQDKIGTLKASVNTKLGTVESNRQDHETRVAAMETGKAAVSCFANSTAFNACFTLDWQSIDASGFNGTLPATADTLQEIAQKVDDIVLGSGSFDQAGDYTLTGDWDFSGANISGIVGSLPTGTEGQTIQYGSGGTPAAVDLAPLAFTDNVSRNATTGVVSVPVTATATSGSAVPLTSGGAYTALSGKENADSTIVKVAEIDTQAEFEALLFPLPSGGVGGYVAAPAYSDSACTAGTYSFHATYGLVYCKATNIWDYQVVSGTSLVWALWNNLTPVTYSLTITPSGFTGADKITYLGNDYTGLQEFGGLTADASFTVTPDTGRAIACTGTGLTDNTGGSYTANTDTTNVVATCTSSAAQATAETLYPNHAATFATGTNASWLQSSGDALATNHASLLSDSNDTTLISKTPGSAATELLNVSDTTMSCSGGSVTLYIRAKSTIAGDPVRGLIYDSSYRYTTDWTLTTNYEDYSYIWTQNPATSTDWTQSAIQTLGLGVRDTTEHTGTISVSKIWVVRNCQ